MKEAKHMLGMLFNEKECKELDYVLRKELDEMLLDLSDQRLDQNIRHAIANRYKNSISYVRTFCSSERAV